MHVPTRAGWTFFIVRGLSGPTVDGYETNTGFHHATSEQKILPEGIHAVQFTNFSGFAMKLKGFPTFLAGHAVEGHFA